MKEQNEKQAIEEMARIIHGTPFSNMHRAVAIYNAGYRKQRVGEWKFRFTLDGDDFYECSVCGRQEVISGLCYERNPAEHFPYCHCGARMKGGE